MNWLTFSILAYFGFALQLLLAANWPMQGHEPMVLLILLVFIGLQAADGRRMVRGGSGRPK